MYVSWENIGRNINCKGDTYNETDNIRVKRQKFDNTKKDWRNNLWQKKKMGQKYSR